MLKGLGSLTVRALALFLLSTPAWAGNDALYISSQPGGSSVTYTDSQGTFAISGKPSGVVAVSFTNSSNFFDSWSFEFQAPTGASLAPGNYDGLQRVPFQGPLQPGADFTVGDSGCDNDSGRFVVRAITTDSNNNVTSFAADFQLYCDASTVPVVGAIRYNSTFPYPVDAPTADAGASQIVQQGTVVQLDGSLSLPGNGAVTAYSWTQLSGPGVTFSNAAAVNPTFTAPAVSLGGADVVLQLKVDNSLALSSTSTVTIHVANPADPFTALYMTSDAGDYIGLGQTYSETPLVALFTPKALAATVNYGRGVQVTVNGGITNDWTLDFAAPLGQTLQVGTSYDMAQGYPFEPVNIPGLSVFGDGRGCSVSGRFVILDLQTDVNGEITAFAADFEQHCEPAVAALHGKIRFNSAVPLDAPWADAGAAPLSIQGATVTLSAAGSDAGGNGESITSYQWTQLSGPSVTLSDPTAASPTFAASTVPLGGADFVFQLTVTNTDGLTSTDTVTIHVANPADPVTALQVASAPGDTAGAGQNVLLSTPTSHFTVSTIRSSIYNGTGVQFGVTGGSPSWVAEFVMPIGQSLQTGTYTSAQSYPWGASDLPGISVYSSAGNICYGGHGQFNILDVQTDGSGNVTSFAADFWQVCSGTAVLQGKIRYNSSVSIYTPRADAGTYQWVRQGGTVALSADASDPGGNGITISSYQWTQLSGTGVTLSDATAADPTFTAPSVPLGGADLSFQLTITNSLGMTSSATLTVHVANSADPAPFTALHTISDPGDQVGGGQTATIDSTQATFSVSPLSNSGIGVTVTDPSDHFQLWQVSMVPPQGQTLQAGVTYDLAQRYPFQSPVLPGLSVNGGCNTLTGRFTILEIRYDQYGGLSSLAADFEQHCNGATPALHGLLRYNSGIAYSAPFADAGPSQGVSPGATVTLDGSSSYAGAGSETIATYQWTQLSGTSVALSDATAAAPTFTAPAVAPGGVDLRFQLTVTNSDGLSGSDVVKVHVANPADPITAMHFASDPGDFIGHGQVNDTTALTAAFTATGNTSGVTINVNGGAVNDWSLQFAPPQGQTLQAGTAYEMAQRYGFQATGSPGLNVTGDGGGCDTVTGRFVVLDIATDGAGNITSFAANFEQHCEGVAPALRGKIRYNTSYPIDSPVAVAGPEQQTIQGDTVTLSGAASDSGGDGNTIVSYQWTQISGPSVILSNPSGVTTTFSAPGVPPGGATPVFQLTITSSDGLTSTEDVTIMVANPNDPITGLYVQGKPDDITGNVQQLLLQPLNGTFALTQPVPNAITIRYTGPANSVWVAKFAPPTGQTLHTGTYTAVVEAGTSTTTSSAGMLLTQDPPGFGNCTTISGQFDVRQVTFDNAGNVTQFAADFKQFCNDGFESDPPILRGKIRYNSTVTLREPTVDAGIDQLAYAGLPVTLDGSASTAGMGSITSYRWTQLINTGDPVITLSDPTAAEPTFTAPNVPAGGQTLSFKLKVTNSLGLSSSDVATVVAHSETDPKTTFYFASDPGDPIGNGTHGFATSDDAFFSFESPPQVMLGVSGFGSPAFSGNWQLNFTSATPWQTIVPGAYLASGQPNAPTIGVTSDSGNCSSPTGQFIIRDIGFSFFGQINELGMDFIQKCPGAHGVLRGSIRFNSPTPVVVNAPTATAANQQASRAGTITLDGSASFPGWGTMTSYLWQQLRGPKVSLSNANSAQASFTLPPGLLESGGSVFMFQLTVKNSLGLSDSATVKVTAVYPDTNRLLFQSDAGDPVGNGATFGYLPSDGIIKTGLLGTNGVSAVLNGDGNWMLDFAAAFKQTLQVGTYSNASLYRAPSAVRNPTLFVGTKPGQCKTVTGDFTVVDVAYGIGHKISTLAVDFNQHCNGIGPALHGKLRFHSSLP